MAGALIHADVDAQDVSLRSLEHSDYDIWNTMSSSQISRDGKWVAYGVQNGAIDGEVTLHLHDLKSSREYVVERGTSVSFTWDSQFVLYRLTPAKKTLKELRKKKTSASDLPKSQLQILELKTGDVITVDRIRSFQTPEKNGDWVACLVEKSDAHDAMEKSKASSSESYEVTSEGLRRPAKKLKLKSRETLAQERGEIEKPEPKEEPASETEQKEDDDGEEEKKKKAAGTPLMLIDLQTGFSRTFPAVVDYELSSDGKSLAMATSVELEDDSERDEGPGDASDHPGDGVHILQLDSGKLTTVASGVGEYKSLIFSEDGKHVAFLTSKDDFDAKSPSWSLYHCAVGQKDAKQIAKEGDDGITYGWWVAPNARPRFSDDGRRLYFDTAPIPEKVSKERASKDGNKGDDSDDEKAKLDIWHWQDPQLQPQQLLQAERERNRTYRAAYNLRSKKIVQIATREVPNVDIDVESPAKIAVANSNVNYRKTLSWDVPGFQDIWLVDLDTGEHTMVLEKVKWTASLSPEGRFIVWFDAEQKKWFSLSTKDPESEPVEISKGIKYPLQDELHDVPSLPRPYRPAGWLVGDQGFVLSDRYDLWKVDLTGEAAPECLTKSFGRGNEIRFQYLRLDVEERAIDPAKPMMLSAFDLKTKASGFYLLGGEGNDDEDAEKKLAPLIMLDESLTGLRKAQDADELIFSRSTFRMCPDLWSSTTDFKSIRRVSDMNPQQENYSWGDAELVHWNATDGQALDGILIKPDGFDPSKKYPMMVYFYERNSDNLHRYYPPAAGRSIICHSFYVSRGYLVFIPDIPYKTGEPGPSAANSILPGVEHLVEMGFVGKDKIGMQGHSWGGYQTAYLVTQTDLFACAESGAPVSNMTSAYGGIRWGSGLSRMFQYERTQSRIGEDLWTARDRYIANSPLFFADKINTPLLILHNDEDGAVPWYQGIELFVALRRLEKPAWMLNYNGDPHWVMGEYNRRDFATRMQQFFDHYLMDAPEPEWMAVGVPAVDKGKKFGLELLEPEAESASPNVLPVEDQ
ncbi:MAG: prolyl oligopeptidase family serine peptidase [Planctomycetota bacterium]